MCSDNSGPLNFVGEKMCSICSNRCNQTNAADVEAANRNSELDVIFRINNIYSSSPAFTYNNNNAIAFRHSTHR